MRGEARTTTNQPEIIIFLVEANINVVGATATPLRFVAKTISNSRAFSTPFSPLFCSPSPQNPLHNGPMAKSYPFMLDPFQQVSIACLEHDKSVLVSTPSATRSTMKGLVVLKARVRWCGLRFTGMRYFGIGIGSGGVAEIAAARSKGGDISGMEEKGFL